MTTSKVTLVIKLEKAGVPSMLELIEEALLNNERILEYDEVPFDEEDALSLIHISEPTRPY